MSPASFENRFLLSAHSPMKIKFAVTRPKIVLAILTFGQNQMYFLNFGFKTQTV